MSVGNGRTPGGPVTQRLDKWLWYARVAKSRTLAATLVTGGKIRVNRSKASKPSQPVKTGDVITSAAQARIRILRVKATGARRGPAEEARALYDELTPPGGKSKSGVDALLAGAHIQGERSHGAGRPTKRDRRQIDRLKSRLP